MSIKIFECELLSDEQLKGINSTVNKSNYKKIFDNKVLVDTAGFVPLDVRIKQFLLAGEQSKINSELFDSDDWRYMFEHVNGNSLEVGDDIEDVAMKLNAIRERQSQILSRKVAKQTEEYTPDEGANTNSEAKSKSDAGSVNSSVDE